MASPREASCKRPFIAFSAVMTSSGSPEMRSWSSRSVTRTPSSFSIILRFWSKEPKTFITFSILSMGRVLSIICTPRYLFGLGLGRYVLQALGAERHVQQPAALGGGKALGERLAAAVELPL